LVERCRNATDRVAAGVGVKQKQDAFFPT
jgi:hypothetical protein